MINIAYKERCAPLLPEDPDRCSASKLGGAGGTEKAAPATSQPGEMGGRTADESGAQSGGIHLLSIFPLTNMPEFARVSCMPVMNVPTPCGAPFCVSRAELRSLMMRILPLKRVEMMLATLDGRADVQLSIRDDDARALGFMARVQ